LARRLPWVRPEFNQSIQGGLEPPPRVASKVTEISSGFSVGDGILRFPLKTTPMENHPMTPL
jgi:hypothetical protein